MKRGLAVVLPVLVLLAAGILTSCLGRGPAKQQIEELTAYKGLTEDTVERRLDEGAELALQGRLDEAIKEFTRAIELDPLFAEAYNSRGLAYSYLGQFELAIQDYDQAIRLNPQNAEAYYNRGLAYSYLGQFERAIQDYAEAIRLDPQYAVAYANRARSYTLLGMDTEAQQDVNQAVELGFEREFLDMEIERLKKQP